MTGIFFSKKGGSRSRPRQTLGILHASKDVPSAHDPASYFNSYRLITAFLAYLDVMP